MQGGGWGVRGAGWALLLLECLWWVPVVPMGRVATVLYTFMRKLLL